MTWISKRLENGTQNIVLYDKERTEHNILGLLGFFSCHMVHPTMHVVLLASVTFLRCLHIALGGGNTGIVSQFSAVKTSTWVN
jgi:hypothetical protein